MRRSKSIQAVLPILACALMVGCAGTSPAPGQAGDPIVDCGELGKALAAAEEQKHAAGTTQRDAWKAVIPFAVAARYVTAIASANEADMRSARVQAEIDRRDCAGHER